jgi:uncharacterized membrane protein YraQ (UPF0718 family)
MKQMLIKALRIFFSDVRQAVVSLTLVLLAGSSATLYLLPQKVLTFAIQKVRIPIPLWTLLVCALFCLILIGFAYSTFRKNRQIKKENDALKAKAEKLVFTEINLDLSNGKDT